MKDIVIGKTELINFNILLVFLLFKVTIIIVNERIITKTNSKVVGKYISSTNFVVTLFKNTLTVLI